MREISKIYKVLVIIMLGVFSLLVVNNALYRHNHLVAGYMYTHAHPFEKDAKDSPSQSHSHSVPELIMLDFLTDSDFLQIAVIACFIGLTSYLLLNTVYRTTDPVTLLVAVKIPRAPPV